MDDCYSEKCIPWVNVLSFNTDSCRVMKGSRGGVVSKLQSVQPKTIDVCCACHLANLAMGAALTKSLFDMGDLLCHIYNRCFSTTLGICFFINLYLSNRKRLEKLR